jgi:hypothetical protein
MPKPLVETVETFLDRYDAIEPKLKNLFAWACDHGYVWSPEDNWGEELTELRCAWLEAIRPSI